MTSTSTPAGWEGILQPGESIVWQGRPEQGFHLDLNIVTILMGVFICGFSLFWMFMAFKLTRGEGFPSQAMPLFGLIFFYQSLKMMGGGALWDQYRRRRTWYTLTDRRAFIGRDMFGHKSLKSWAIDRFDTVEYEYGPPSHVWFASESSGRAKRQRIGFRHLDDAHEVHGLIRDLQQDQSA